MSRPPATYASLLLAALAFAVAVRASTFTPWGTDSAAYVESAQRWADGVLLEPSPLPLWAAWAGEGHHTVALGIRPAATRGTDASEYPPGYPVLMAAAAHVDVRLGPYLVAPLCFAVAVWCVSRLGSRLGGPWCGVLAALLLAATPVTMVFAVQPMSDVPALACWLVAWTMVTRPGVGAALAAGSAVALAVLVRPTLAPLTAVIGLLAFVGPDRGWQWRRAIAVGAMASVGVGVLLWSQALLYGGALTPSYRNWDAMYAVAHIPQSLELYPRLLTVLHSPWVFTGLVAPPLLVWGRPVVHREVQAIVWAAVAIAVINLATYLPFWPYDDPHFLRYQLPAIAALLLLLAGVTTWAWARLRRWTWALAPVSLVPAAFVLAAPGPMLGYGPSLRGSQERVALMATYLVSTIPENAVILAHLHGGAIVHSTSAPIVRLDQIGAGLDAVVDDLVRHGHAPVLVVGEGDERPGFASRFPDSRFRALDWPPRARAIDTTALDYFVLSDRERYLRGERWPVDVLRPPP